MSEPRHGRRRRRRPATSFDTSNVQGDIPVVIVPDDVDIAAVRRMDEFLAKRVQRRERELAQIERELDAEIGEEIALEEAAAGTLLAPVRLARFAAITAAGLLLTLFVVGWGYYVLPAANRPFHYYHHLLRPSGPLGLTLGIGGTLIMIASLAYLLRKRFVSLARIGSLQAWMGFHVFAGVLGPAIVLFHAAFVPTSAVGTLALVAMAIVVASGVIGRYLFAHVPRSIEGRELEFEDVRRRLIVYRRKLMSLGVSPKLLRIDAPTPKGGRSPWLIQAIIRVLRGDHETRREYERVKRSILRNPELGERGESILLLVRRLCSEREWMIRYRELHKLMGAWRFLHRWLAIVLLAAVIFHVLIAVKFGNLWIFGGGN